MSNERPRLRMAWFAGLAVLVLAACQQPSATTSSPLLATAVARPTVAEQPVPGGPTLVRPNTGLRKVADVGSGNIKLAQNPRDGMLYYLTTGTGVYQVDPAGGQPTRVIEAGEIVSDANPSGMAFGSDGALYVVANRPLRPLTQAIVRKGTPQDDGSFTWQTLMTTEPYPASNTQFDHLWNGIAVSPDNKWLYLNAGSRTDHGEIQNSEGEFPDTREIALTAKIFRISATTPDQMLPNDEAALEAGGFIYARGTRNAYDLAVAPNGDLFGIDNGPDADYSDELNWLREGMHYGFPWRFGDQDNPQQFPNYDSSTDKHLHQDFAAVKNGSYANDPTYPKAPEKMTDPVVSLGPDAVIARADDGSEYNATKQGKTLSTFTPHRSPLGLSFADNDSLPADMRSNGDSLGAFVLSWGAAGGTLSDKGQDLLFLSLQKQGEGYQAVTTQVARDLKYPIDSVLVGNKLYVLEYGQDGAIWELTFQ